MTQLIDCWKIIEFDGGITYHSKETHEVVARQHIDGFHRSKKGKWELGVVTYTEKLPSKGESEDEIQSYTQYKTAFDEDGERNEYLEIPTHY